MFRGVFTALVTPFRNGALDEDAYRQHIDWQIREGVHGIVPCGTTGESATLTHAEHRRVLDIAIADARGRVPVIAGTGSNNTDEAVALTLHAKKAGADAALLITPYYNKPTQEGLYRHYKKVAEETKFPIIAYNVPGRTGVSMAPETLARLREIPEIIGVKEATANLILGSDILEQCGPDFDVISGDDFTILPLLCIGGVGVISVVSNVAPADTSALCNAFFAGDLEKARALHFKLQPLCRAMFLETSPIPVKTALSMMGRMSDELRLPLCELTEGNRQKLAATLRAYGLLEAGK